MAFEPQPPFPKSRGDTIRSTDWNDLIVEVQRLDTDKVNRSGDRITGSLSVTETMAIGTTPSPNLSLRIQTSGADRSPLLELATPNSEDFLSIHGGRRGNQAPYVAWRRGDLRMATATTAGGAGFKELLRVNSSDSAPARLEVEGSIRTGQLMIGAWPANASQYVFFGSNNLDQTQAGNYALLQHAPATGGTTYLNSPQSVRLRINNADKLVIQNNDNIDVIAPSNLRFGAQTRQMIHLWRGGYGIGVQNSTQYYRTGAHFAWFRGGVHDNGALNPGSGGIRLMALNSAGDLILSARTNPTNASGGSRCRALADLNNRLSINHGTDFANGVLMGGNLRITGNTASKPGGGSWANSSDVRLKQNVRPLAGALDRLLRLRGVFFEWKEPEKQGNLTGVQIGMLAHEVEDVFPEWISTDWEGYKQLAIRGFEALTVEALRDLKVENEALRSQNQALEQRLATLEAQLKSPSSAIAAPKNGVAHP